MKKAFNLILCLLLVITGFSQNFGITASSIQKSSYILDDYAGAGAAYSITRKLSSAYTGDAFRVIRISDSTTDEIGFDGNEIDESALSTFCSGTTCYIKLLYDQSGNNYDLDDVSGTSLWRVVNSGTLEKDNGKLSAVYVSGQGFFKTSGVDESEIWTYSAGEADASVVWIGQIGPSFSTFYQGSDGGGGDIYECYYRTSPSLTLQAQDENVSSGTGGSFTTDQLVLEVYWDANDDNCVVYDNNTIYDTYDNDPTSQGAASTFTICGTASFNAPERFQEAIFWNQSHGDERTDLYTALDDFYGF